MQRAWAYVVSAVVLTATLWPISWSPPDDSFPLSSFPMFSNRRPAAVVVRYAVGIRADGGREAIRPGLVANGEVLQARAVISRTLAAGRKPARALCAEIAARVAVDTELTAVREIRLITGTHDAVAYLTGRDRIGKERVHAACPVPGREAAP